MKAKLQNTLRTGKAKLKANQKGRMANLNIKGMVEDSDGYGLLKPVEKLIFTLVKTGDFAAVVKHIEEIKPQAVLSVFSDPAFVQMSGLLTKQFDGFVLTPAQCEEFLPRYKDWYTNSPNCPYAAAAYATALGATGYTYRGTGFNNTVTQKGHAKHTEYALMGQAIFEKHFGQHHEHWYWRLCRLDYSYMECPSPEFDDLYDRYLMCEQALPFCPGLMDKISFLLLPRWYGSFESVDKFIRQKSDDAAPQYGDGLYARLYTHIIDCEVLDSLLVDKNRYRKAAQDWFTHFPCDYYRMFMASTAFNSEMYDCALDLLEGIEIYHSDANETGEDLNVMNSICREHTGR